MIGLRSSVPLLVAAYSAVVSANVIPGAFIFEFEENQDKASALNSVLKNGEVRMDLNFELFNGVSVQLHDVEKADETVNKLAALPAIKRWWPVTVQKAPNVKVHWTGNPEGGNNLMTRDDSTTDALSPHIMTQIDKLHAKGFTGKGFNIAVIDSGIDYKHPSLGGCFGEGCLVTHGYDFVGDAYDGTNAAVPGNDPMDCNGHGTHLAGIIAATDKTLGFTGGAPGATLSAYRIFGCDGRAASDVILAAVNRAYQDKASIINMSLGAPGGWKEDPWAVLSSRIVAKGVPMIVSTGNSGEQGIFYTSDGSSGEGVAAIASFDNVLNPTLVYYGTATIRDDKTEEFSYVLANREKFNVTLPLWANTFDVTTPADFCSPLPADTPDLSEYVVLVRAGSCPHNQTMINAAAKGAKYVMLYNNDDSHPTALRVRAPVPTTVIGVGFTHKKTGESWVEALKAGKKVTVTLGSALDTKKTLKNIDNPATGGALSKFTSWGPTWTMDVKPQFGAPGGSILSTYPRANGSYAVVSGTSMSAPLMASIYALIGEARGTLDPTLLQNLLAANANAQLFNDGARFYEGNLAPVPQQGAGMVQAYAAAFATTLLEPSSLSFNETTYFAASKNFTLTNQGNDEVTYEISYVPTLTTMTLKSGGKSVIPFPGEFCPDSATIKFSENKVTLTKGDKVTVEVLATPPELDASRLPLWSGYVRINGTDGTSLSLPYQGLVGSLRDHTVLNSDATYISKSNDTDFKPVAPNTVFTIPRAGSSGTFVAPLIMFTPNLGTRLVQFHIVPISEEGTEKTPLGQMSSPPAMNAPRGRDGRGWDGKLADGKYAPEGSYKIAVKALRLYGDEKNTEDWDESISPPFAIKYA